MELKKPDARIIKLISNASASLAMAGIEFTIEASMTGNFSQQEIVGGVISGHGIQIVDIIKSLPLSDEDRQKALDGTIRAMRERFNAHPMSNS